MSELFPAGFGTSNLSPEDFQTDRLVIVQYPAGSGGKFLMNCLGLSNDVFLQDINLAIEQIQGNLSPQKKLDLLIERMSASKNSWTDLNMGCFSFFGVYLTIESTECLYPELAYGMQWNKQLREVYDSGKIFFIVSQTARTTRWFKQIWPNAKIINFYNTQPFFEKYRQNFTRLPQYHHVENAKREWDKIRQAGWPELPPMWIENFYLPPFDDIVDQIDLNKIKYIPSKTYFEQVEELEQQKQAEMFRDRIFADNFQWDTSWYCSEEKFLKHISEVYKFLKLSDCSIDSVRELYCNWINCLENIQDYIYQK